MEEKDRKESATINVENICRNVGNKKRVTHSEGIYLIKFHMEKISLDLHPFFHFYAN